MSFDDPSILKDFQDESKGLLEKMTSILDQCEDDPTQVKALEEFGLNVDRIMGGAKSLGALSDKSVPVLEQIGDYAAVCKAVAYKASQIRGHDEFYNVCVYFLMDATEVLEDLVDRVEGQAGGDKVTVNKAFIDRLKWLSDKFGQEYRATVATEPERMSNNEIEALLKKLGV